MSYVRPLAPSRTPFVFIVVCVALVAVGAGYWLATQRSSRPLDVPKTPPDQQKPIEPKAVEPDSDREQARDDIAFLMALERSKTLDTEWEYWTDMGIRGKLLDEMLRESRTIFENSKRTDKELDRKWGVTRKALDKLDPRLLAAYEAARTRLRAAVRANLDGNARQIEIDIARAEATIREEVPLALPVRPKNATPQQDEEFDRLYDSLVAVARARCDLERTKRITDETPKIQAKWIEKTRADNRKVLDKIEAELLR